MRQLGSQIPLKYRRLVLHACMKKFNRRLVAPENMQHNLRGNHGESSGGKAAKKNAHEDECRRGRFPGK